MDLAQVRKKLREAEFFLGRMMEHEQQLIGDREPFDFYLSAFLSAARTVDYRLRHEQNPTYKAWRERWDSSLTGEENALIKFMVDDRNFEVHESGSTRSLGSQVKEFGGGVHRLGASEMMITAPVGVPPAVLHKSTYKLTIGAVDHDATKASELYLKLLNRMVSQFQHDNP
jgi:hypothetical protein